MIPQLPPYRLHKNGNRFVRKIMYTSPRLNPGVVLKINVDLKNILSLKKEKNISIDTFLIKALAIALSRHPRLNYLAFLGDMIWAGDNSKIAVVLEEKKWEEVSQYIVKDAERKSLESIQQEIVKAKENVSADPPSAFVAFLDKFPRFAFWFARKSGFLAKNLVETSAPIMVSNLNVAGIDEMITTGVPYAMLINPGYIKDDTMPVYLSFNHQLANARAVAVFFAEVKRILEEACEFTHD